MKRRSFLKGAALGAGVLASGVLPGRGQRKASAAGNTRQGADFYKIDAFFAGTALG